MDTKSQFHIKSGKDFEPKELFKEITGLVREHFQQSVGALDLLDVGCATGELFAFLKQQLGTTGACVGFDVDPELVKNAQERFADLGIRFFEANAADFSVDQKFDVITMTSVLSYFDDPYPVLSHTLSHLKDGGLLIISGLFNEWNVDVLLKYRLENDDPKGEGTPLNQFSKKRFTEFLDAAGFTAAFSKQVMPFDLPPDPSHPVRSWTVQAGEERMMTNGLKLMYNLDILQITKKHSV